jgi:peptidoglycan hydrolase-like protein with peptidoglycan-binding domain
MSQRDDAVALMLSLVGTKAAPNNRNKVIFNDAADAEAWPGYHPRNGQPWCATTEEYVLRRVGLEMGYPLFYTPEDVNRWKQLGRWTDGIAGIQPGDLVYYRWSGTLVQHTGMCVNVHPFQTVEGNTGYAPNVGVWRFTSPDVAHIVGYGSPPYADDSTPTDPPTDEPWSYADAVYPGLLKVGAKGYPVEAVQYHLSHYHGIPTDVDGDFGPMTKASVLAFQRNVNVPTKLVAATGNVGMMTWRLLGLTPR